MLRLTLSAVTTWLVLALSPARAESAEERAIAFVENLGGTVSATKSGLVSRLSWSVCDDSEVTDAGLRELAAFKDLNSPRACRSRGLPMPALRRSPRQESRSTSLERYAGHGCGPEGRGRASAKLTELSLHRTQVTDGGLKHLGRLNGLTKLNLSATSMTGKGLKELAGLKGLTALSLHDTKLTDEGLRELPAVKSLTFLQLGGTRITDAGLKELAALKNLTKLDLSYTEVTDAGVKELQKSLPECQIDNAR